MHNKSKRHLLLSAGATFLGLGAGLYVYNNNPSPTLNTTLNTNIVHSALTLLKQSSLILNTETRYTLPHNRPILINVWASWCSPCVEELPELSTLAIELKQTNPHLEVVGIGVDSLENIQTFLLKTPIAFSTIIGDNIGIPFIQHLNNPQGVLPFTVLFNAKGIPIEQRIGRVYRQDIIEWLRIHAI